MLRCMFAWLSLCLSRISYRQINWMCWGEEWNSTYRHDNSRQWKTGQQTRRQQRTKDNRTQLTPAVELFTSEILSYCNSIPLQLRWSWMNWIALWNTQHYIRHYCNADCTFCFCWKLKIERKFRELNLKQHTELQYVSTVFNPAEPSFDFLFSTKSKKYSQHYSSVECSVEFPKNFQMQFNSCNFSSR